MKRCSRCRQEKSSSDFRLSQSAKDGLQNRCKPCQIEGNREWTANNRGIRRASLHRQELRRRELGLPRRDRNVGPAERAAHQAVQTAINNETLYRPSKCSNCGNSNSPIQAHHEDYSQPLNVLWLCSPCHGYLHAHGNLPESRMEVAA